MSECCKECFIKTWLDSKEIKAYNEGRLLLFMSKDNDWCDGCCTWTKVVDRVWEVTHNNCNGCYYYQGEIGCMYGEEDVPIGKPRKCI